MSHVAMGLKQCPVCGKEHSNGAEILLHKRLKDIEDTVTGMHLCEEHEKLHIGGFVCLLEINNGSEYGDSIKMSQADRTGRTCHVKREAFAHIFNVPLDPNLPCVFVDTESYDHVVALYAKVEAEEAIKH